MRFISVRKSENLSTTQLFARHNNRFINLPEPDMFDELVAWLDTDTSLMEPSHFNVSDDDVLSELLFSVILFAEEADWRSDCDQWDDLDNNSLSCRNLKTMKFNK